MDFERIKEIDLEIRRVSHELFKLKNIRRKGIYEEKIKLNEELKKYLEEILEYIPNDKEFKVKLMYVNIRLNELEEARKIGYELLENNQEPKVISGIITIEEGLENYDEAITYIDKMIEQEPDNEYYKNKKQKVIAKKENKEQNKIIKDKEFLYKKIATLETSIRAKTERRQRELVLQGEKTGKGEKADKEKIEREVYLETYKEVKEIAEEIILMDQKEIVARQRLVKALYIIDEKEEAFQEANELLTLSENNEIALWYMAKIEREKGDLLKEKEYLEQIINNSIPGTQINAQRRLSKVNEKIQEKEREEELKRLREESYTEEARLEFLEEIQKQFLRGEVRGEDFIGILRRARKYPNFYKSFIEIVDLKSYVTGDLNVKLEELERYVDEEYSMTPEEYNGILDEISSTRDQIEQHKQYRKIEEYKYRKDRYDETNEQRQYSKEIVEKLKKGEITKEQLPQIVRKLESFSDSSRSVFLIMKLYEVLYDKEEAYKRLGRYTMINGLPEQAMKNIKSMKESLIENKGEGGGEEQQKKEGEER